MINFEHLDIQILKKICSSYNLHMRIKGYSKMSKAELVEEMKKYLKLENGKIKQIKKAFEEELETFEKAHKEKKEKHKAEKQKKKAEKKASPKKASPKKASPKKASPKKASKKISPKKVEKELKTHFKHDSTEQKEIAKELKGIKHEIKKIKEPDTEMKLEVITNYTKDVLKKMPKEQLKAILHKMGEQTTYKLNGKETQMSKEFLIDTVLMHQKKKQVKSKNEEAKKPKIKKIQKITYALFEKHKNKIEKLAFEGDEIPEELKVNFYNTFSKNRIYKVLMDKYLKKKEISDIVFNQINFKSKKNPIGSEDAKYVGEVEDDYDFNELFIDEVDEIRYPAFWRFRTDKSDVYKNFISDIEFLKDMNIIYKCLKSKGVSTKKERIQAKDIIGGDYIGTGTHTKESTDILLIDNELYINGIHLNIGENYEAI